MDGATDDALEPFAVFPLEISVPPRARVERQFTDLRLWREHDSGGHFAAMERPDELVADVREFFRPCADPSGVRPRPGAKVTA